MKKNYEEPEIIIINIEKDDVICTSGCGGCSVDTDEECVFIN